MSHYFITVFSLIQGWRMLPTVPSPSIDQYGPGLLSMSIKFNAVRVFCLSGKNYLLFATNYSYDYRHAS